MQWLTAILAFATTMLVFAVIVTALVETIHRILRSRTSGLRYLLGQFYDQVLAPRIKAANIDLDRNEFIEKLTRVRATSHGWFGWCFTRLSRLPTESFMERLGSTSFAEIMKEDDAKRNTLLKDIAQKYETFGTEASTHFESGARVFSLIVAVVVAWTFYVHPYDLLTSYMKNPEVAVKVAALADNSMETYQKLVNEAEQLKKEQDQNGEKTKLTDEEVNKLFDDLKSDIDNAKARVDDLSTAGAPVGWPAVGDKVGAIVLYQDDKAKAARTKREEREAKGEPVLKGQPEVGVTVAIYYPKAPQDIFWLLIGGLLIGLGAPYWAKLVAQLTQAQNISKNLTSILKPENQSPTGTATAGNETPVTTEAFRASANAQALTDKSGPSGQP